MDGLTELGISFVGIIILIVSYYKGRGDGLKELKSKADKEKAKRDEQTRKALADVITKYTGARERLQQIRAGTSQSSEVKATPSSELLDPKDQGRVIYGV